MATRWTWPSRARWSWPRGGSSTPGCCGAPIGAGARHVAERVTSVARRSGATAGGGRHGCDLVVGADGAGSLVRRTFLSPTPPARLAMATGWFARGDAPMLVRFTPGLAGYLWLFPRPDHVGVGICAPLARAAHPRPRRAARVRGRARRSPPSSSRTAAATRTPSRRRPPTRARSPRSRARAGRWWATRPRWPTPSPARASTTRSGPRSCWPRPCARAGPRASYAARALADFGQDLLKAAALRDRFFAPGFAPRMIRYADRSRAIRGVLGDLVLGDQGYVGLKRRLVRAAPRFAVEMAAGALLGRRALSAGSGARR